MPMQQAEDFRTESRALHALLVDVDPARFSEPTQFKDWTINHVLQHLHVWNMMADLSLTNEEAFSARLAEIMSETGGMRVFENKYLKGMAGQKLLETWQKYFELTSDHFAGTDPKQRLKWAGPDMSARSSITARLMETWAHGQEVYDHFGMERVDTDRIRNIAHLGVNTFGWTYMTRGREAPDEKPYVKLTAPSGAIWEWNSPSETNLIFGSATDFCQVVTQVRNIADTHLTALGETAAEWMSMAQCFAGPPETPPPPGARRRKT